MANTEPRDNRDNKTDMDKSDGNLYIACRMLKSKELTEAVATLCINLTTEFYKPTGGQDSPWSRSQVLGLLHIMAPEIVKAVLGTAQLGGYLP